MPKIIQQEIDINGAPDLVEIYGKYMAQPVTIVETTLDGTQSKKK
jgi:hypothetical protein